MRATVRVPLADGTLYVLRVGKDDALIPSLLTLSDRSEEHTSELQSRFGIAYAAFCFNDTATTEIYTLSLHDALPILPLADGTLYVLRVGKDDALIPSLLTLSD